MANKWNDILEILGLLLVLIVLMGLLSAGLTFIYNLETSCNRHNGVLIKQPIGYTCLEID